MLFQINVRFEFIVVVTGVATQLTFNVNKFVEGLKDAQIK